MSERYVAFEGPIGAGKTTLATYVARKLNYDLVLEEFEQNEFLADFYVDRTRWALPMQLTFLAERYAKVKSIPERRRRGVVADYFYGKDAIFASILLKGRELRLYRRIISLLDSVEIPDRVVYVDAENDVLLARIRQRARAYEQSLTSEYLDQLRSVYHAKLLTDRRLRLVRLDTSALDLDSAEQLDEILELIFRND